MNLSNITYDHIDDLSLYPHIIFLKYLSVPSVVSPRSDNREWPVLSSSFFALFVTFSRSYVYIRQFTVDPAHYVI